MSKSKLKLSFFLESRRLFFSKSGQYLFFFIVISDKKYGRWEWEGMATYPLTHTNVTDDVLS